MWILVEPKIKIKNKYFFIFGEENGPKNWKLKKSINFKSKSLLYFLLSYSTHQQGFDLMLMALGSGQGFTPTIGFQLTWTLLVSSKA